MDPITASLAVAQVGSSIIGGISAKKAAKEAAKEQAKLTGLQRAEEIRQKKFAARQQVAGARTSVYASNLQLSGSSRQYVQSMDMENMREIAYARYAAKKEQEAIMAGAQGAGNSLFFKAAGDAIGAAASAFATRTPAGGGASGGGSSGGLGNTSGWRAAETGGDTSWIINK